MNIDGFLKVPDIPGPSIRDGHEEEMEIHGVDFKMYGPHDPGSLSRSGRVLMEAIVFSKFYDMGSPFLKQALWQNKTFGEVKFSARRTIEGATSDYLVVTLTEASVMSYEMHPSLTEANKIEERVGFAYKSITFTYDGSFETVMDIHTGM